MRFLIILFLTIVYNTVSSQEIRVIDKNNIGIKNLAIFNKKENVSIITNSDGYANIDKFDKNSILYFQHPSYKNISVSKTDIINSDFIVKMYDRIIEFDDIIVSAYRWEQNINEVPNKISRICAKEIFFNNPQTSADLLETSNEVFIQKSQLGGGSPMIRGFATNSVLLVVDRVRMNNAIFRSGNLQNVISLDVNSIESSEIIFGPGSVTYGSDALGGVMDFHTKRVKLSTSEKLFINGNALARYSSANKENTSHADFLVSSAKFGLYTSYSYTIYDDLLMGKNGNNEYVQDEYAARINGIDTILGKANKNLQVPNAFSQSNFIQKIRYRPSENFDFNYAFHYSKTSNIPRYERLIQYNDNELKYAEWYYGPQIWMMNSLNIKYSDSNLFFNDAELTLAMQNYTESRNDRKFNKEELRSRTEKVKAYSLNLDFNKKINEASNMFYGVEAIYNNVNSDAYKENIIDGSRYPTSTRYPDGKNNYYTVAAYLSYKNNFSDKYYFISGLRYNYVNLYSTLIDTTFFNFPFNSISLETSAFNGSAGVVYKPDDTWQLKTNISSGFHAPNIDDIAKVFDSEPGTVIVPNPNLKPEYAYNLDFGVIKSINKRCKIEVGAFYTLLTNAMVRRDFQFNQQDSIIYDGLMSKVSALVNSDKAYIYGFSGNVSVELPYNLIFKSNINYTHGEDQDGLPLRHVAPLFGKVMFIYRKEKINASLYLNYNGEISNKMLALSEQSKTHIYATDNNGNPYSPSWYSVNFMSSYEISANFSINCGIKNILDNRYRPYSSGIAAPGRNFILAVRASF